MRSGKRILILFLFGVLGISSSFSQYVKLFDFAGAANGSNPRGDLFFDGTYLYGMTNAGGTLDSGTIFKIKPDGTGYVKLLDFAGLTNGSNPMGSLISDGTFLYGMTYDGGTSNAGTIFRIMTDGSNYAKLLDFNGTNGYHPYGSLLSDGTYLYGTTYQGGNNSGGVVFKIKMDGTGFLKLHNFNSVMYDGYGLHGTLIADGTFLYGTTESGGYYGYGTVFKIKPDSTGYAHIIDLNWVPSGGHPEAALMYDGTYLYGTTYRGGVSGQGTIFKIKPDGTGFLQLWDFTHTLNGYYLYCAPILNGGYLWGMTEQGPYGSTIFKIKPDGTGYTQYNDLTNLNGYAAYGSLVSDGNFAYAMTSAGGANGKGVLFKYDLVCSVPLLQSSNIVFSNLTTNSVKATWTNGDGGRRIVMVAPVAYPANPVNGIDYTPNTVYSGSGAQVVYNGTGNTVTVTGLSSINYIWFRVYEANCSGGRSLYRTGTVSGNPNRLNMPWYQIPVRPEGDSQEELIESIQVYPNPTTGSITVQSAESAPIQRLTLYSSDGRIVKAIVNCPLSIVNLNLQGLSAGIYFLDCLTANGSERVKVVKY